MESSLAHTNRLESLEQLATEVGAPQVAAQARGLNDRVRNGLFYVACVGQFKRGKSTLLNALVGDHVLPVGVVPVTAVVTVVRYGVRSAARARFATGWRAISPNELAQYVTEEENPENEKEVELVEVFAPSDLLASGMCLVDTPGIGSVFAGNTEATQAFVPHIDAALVVLGADPPISGDELALVSDIASQCSELLFVLSKADKLTDQEREEADSFTRRVLKDRAGLDAVHLFDVSAAERLAGQGPPRGWPKLVEALETLARGSGADLVHAAEERGLALLTDRLRRTLDEQRGALLRPVDESERRLEALQKSVADAQQALGDLDYLFAAEADRLARAFSDSKQQFLERRTALATQQLIEECRALAPTRGPALRHAAVKLTLAIATRQLDAWLAEAEPAAEEQYARAMERFVELSSGFLTEIKGSGDPALAGLPSRVNAEVGFRWDSRLFYKDLFRSAADGPLTWFVDLFRTRAARMRSVEKAACDRLVRLLETNSTRIENDLNERVLESRRRFAFELRSLLQEVVESATSSLARARDVHAEGSEAVQAELERLDALGDRLARVCELPAR